jgi:hypothetical protein
MSSAAVATKPAVSDPYAATNQQPIRWGLLGTGKIAEDFANGQATQTLVLSPLALAPGSPC